MGRRAQTEAIREAKGDPGRRAGKTRQAIDTSTDKRGDMPAELTGDAAKIWKIQAPELRRMKFLRDTELHVFARYCKHLAHYNALTLYLDENGYTYTTDTRHGKMDRMRPEYNVRERTEKHLVELEDRFGMNCYTRQMILQRMAGLVPAPPHGELPLQQPGQNPNDPSDSGGDARLPSPVGLLPDRTTSIN